MLPGSSFSKTDRSSERNDRGSLVVDNDGVAAARVMGTVGGLRGVLLVIEDLAKQFR